MKPLLKSRGMTQYCETHRKKSATNNQNRKRKTDDSRSRDKGAGCVRLEEFVERMTGLRGKRKMEVVGYVSVSSVSFANAPERMCSYIC
jgi:hypothetical protein